jgi:hypothetical protein
LDGVEEITEVAIDRPIYTGDYTEIDRGCWNYHFRVFRAKGTSAMLTLSDWASADSPGGEIGHEIVWDHIRLKPHGNYTAE